MEYRSEISALKCMFMVEIDVVSRRSFKVFLDCSDFSCSCYLMCLTGYTLFDLLAYLTVLRL